MSVEIPWFFMAWFFDYINFLNGVLSLQMKPISLEGFTFITLCKVE